MHVNTHIISANLMDCSIRLALSIPGGIRGVQLAVTVDSFDGSFGLLVGLAPFEPDVGCLLTSSAILMCLCETAGKKI